MCVKVRALYGPSNLLGKSFIIRHHYFPNKGNFLARPRHCLVNVLMLTNRLSCRVNILYKF